MNILALLKKLDRRLEQEERLIICGGMAIALAFGGKRQTQDLDVIAPVPISRPLLEQVKLVAEEEGVDPDWLNDACKGYASYLPAGWIERLIPVKLGFKNLKISSLGKPDLLMLKLKAARERDLADIQTLGIDKNDAKIIIKNLEQISKFDAKTAIAIQLRLEEWNLV